MHMCSNYVSVDFHFIYLILFVAYNICIIYKMINVFILFLYFFFTIISRNLLWINSGYFFCLCFLLWIFFQTINKYYRL